MEEIYLFLVTGKAGPGSWKLSPEYFHAMELDKTMEIGFSNLFSIIFPNYFRTVGEVQFFHWVFDCEVGITVLYTVLATNYWP